MTKTISSISSIKGYKESKIAKSEHNDCSVRAISNAFNINYDKAHKFLTENYYRLSRKGVSSLNWHKVNDKFSDENTEIFNKKIKKIEYDEVEVDAKCCVRKSNYWEDGSSVNYKKKLKLYTKRGSKYSQMTVGSFLKKYKKGVYIISVRSHTFTIKDSVVYGNSVDGVKMRVPIEKVWEIV